MNTALAAPDSAEEYAIVWERVAEDAIRRENDAVASAHRWMSQTFTLEIDNAVKDAAIAALTEEVADLRRRLSAYGRDNKALRYANRARERDIVRRLEQIRDLTRQLPRVEQHRVQAEEAFRVLHPVESVIGAVVDLHPHQDGPRTYLAGICPFCTGDHVSLVVRPWFQQFACYTCGAAGDVLRFLELYHAKEAA